MVLYAEYQRIKAKDQETKEPRYSGFHQGLEILAVRIVMSADEVCVVLFQGVEIQLFRAIAGAHAPR